MLRPGCRVMSKSDQGHDRPLAGGLCGTPKQRLLCPPSHLHLTSVYSGPGVPVLLGIQWEQRASAVLSWEEVLEATQPTVEGGAGLPMLSRPLVEEIQGFPGGSVVENLPANAGDTGSSPGLGRSHMPPSCGATRPVRHNY